ncbi:MAG: PAC2 family protein [Candidatus Eiseniibacteriota bacterium]
MNGLIVGIAKLFKMRGMCLLGETSGYVMDAIASKSVLSTLMQVTDLEVGMQDMENRAKDTEMLIRTIEQQVANQVTPPGSTVGHTQPRRQHYTAYIS